MIDNKNICKYILYEGKIRRKKMKKKLFAMILCLVMILSSASILSEVSFAEGEKTFTLIKGSDVVGEYDKFYDAIGAMDVNDKTTRYTITVNKDAVVPDSQRGGYFRTNNKFRITSGTGGPYTLRREGTWGLLAIQNDAELILENITLDGSNSCQCFFISNNGRVTIGNGATIQNFVDTPNDDGSVIYMTGGTLNVEDGATIQNNTSNTAGGVIQAYGGTTINISGGTFKNNKTSRDGGAIAAYGNLNITGGTFEGNEARIAGAIMIGQNNTVTISNATFKNNKASTGGAIYSSKDLTITKTSFEANEANWAGAIYAKKALTLSENTFSKNTSKNAGGALYLVSGGSNITCTFEENIAQTQGGAIYIKAGDNSIKGSEFTKNLSGTGGGAIFINHGSKGTTSVEKANFTQNASNYFGGGIYLGQNSKLDLKTSSFTKNEAAFGAGLASAGEGSPDANTNNIKVEATNFTENLALMGGGIFTAFPTEITNCTFTKNKAVLHPQDDQKNPHSSGVGGAIEILDNKTIIKGTKFEENWAYGSGGALGLSGVKRGQDDTIVGIKDNLKVEISDNTNFIGNSCEKGQGGAIFTIPYLYDIHGYKSDIDEDELKAKAYLNITTSDNTVFKNNVAKLGYSNPPENYAIYTDLKFKENSFTQTQPTKDLAKSLLNNYDINYMANNIVVPEANTVTLTLDENHAHGKITDYDVMKGEAIDSYLYTAKRKGYIFRGWSYNRDFLDEVRKGDLVYGDTVLYAIWKKDKAKDEVAELEEIKGMTHKAYIFGYPDGTVRPNGEITRAEAAAMLARLLEIESIGSADKPMFPDTPSAWYNKAINAVVQRGIMKGYPDGTFKPNDAITRAEFTQMISTIDNKPYGTAPFTDVVGHWAERPIGSEYQAGRILGYPDGTFRPDHHITRCEAAVILNKIFERNFDNMSLLKCKNPQMIKYFTDLDISFWGYNDMVEATNTHEYVRRVKNRVEENWLLIK